MTEETNNQSEKLRVVRPKVDDAFVADLRRELNELKHTVREVASKVETVSDESRRSKAR